MVRLTFAARLRPESGRMEGRAVLSFVDFTGGFKEPWARLFGLGPANLSVRRPSIRV